MVTFYDLCQDNGSKSGEIVNLKNDRNKINQVGEKDLGLKKGNEIGRDNKVFTI